MFLGVGGWWSVCRWILAALFPLGEGAFYRLASVMVEFNGSPFGTQITSHGEGVLTLLSQELGSWCQPFLAGQLGVRIELGQLLVFSLGGCPVTKKAPESQDVRALTKQLRDVGSCSFVLCKKKPQGTQQTCQGGPAHEEKGWPCSNPGPGFSSSLISTLSHFSSQVQPPGIPQ